MPSDHPLTLPEPKIALLFTEKQWMQFAFIIGVSFIVHAPMSLPLTPPLLPPQLPEDGKVPDDMDCSHLSCDPRQSVCLPQQLSSVICRTITASVAMGAPVAHTSMNTAVPSARAEQQTTSRAEHLDFRTGEPLRSYHSVLG